MLPPPHRHTVLSQQQSDGHACMLSTCRTTQVTLLKIKGSRWKRGQRHNTAAVRGGPVALCLSHSHTRRWGPQSMRAAACMPARRKLNTKIMCWSREQDPCVCVQTPNPVAQGVSHKECGVPVMFCQGGLLAGNRRSKDTASNAAHSQAHHASSGTTSSRQMHSVWAESSRPKDTKDTQIGDDKGSDKYLQTVVITNAQSILKEPSRRQGRHVCSYSCSRPHTAAA